MSQSIRPSPNHFVCLLPLPAFPFPPSDFLLFPLSSRSEAARSNAATVLVAGNSLLLLALLVGTGLYGFAELKWSSLIVVTGLVVLFAPGLFEVWPAALRDGRKGLVVLVGVQILALAVLAKVAGPTWANMSS